MARVLVVLFIMMVSAIPAHAEENVIRMLIVDPDPKGANVRDEPGGKIIRVIARDAKTDEETEMRAVDVLYGREAWFNVRLSDGTEGWMHRSVLGSCASGTEDGDPHLFADPDSFGPSREIREGTPLGFEFGPVMASNTIWAKMSYTDAAGKKMTGWVPRECLFSNPYNDCRAKK